VIADVTRIEHKKIKLAITKQKIPLESFGKLVSYGDSLGGRGNESGYQLNEQQATLLITFLKNTPVVVAFKTELVRQFYLMREELFKRQINRQQLKPIRRCLTDIIQERTPDKKWAYKQYTDLAYKAALGRAAAQIRKERNAKTKDVAIDYMTSDEIRSVARTQDQISVLIDVGMDYHQIKSLLLSKTLSARIA
jgi:phage regulator Rha-like protein